ncbi:MAG: trypsin-like serine protease [Deltaproteobacteria bacterium]|nr:trypsin-like serine protease [Deltaproteobacteria bacterium]
MWQYRTSNGQRSLNSLVSTFALTFAVSNCVLCGCHRFQPEQQKSVTSVIENSNARSGVGSSRDGLEKPSADKNCLGIVGGAPTVEFPNVGLIGNVDGFCTATILSDNTMLTASHCLEDTPTGDVVYFPGSNYDQVSLQNDVDRTIPPLKAIIGSRALTNKNVAPYTDGDLSEAGKDIAILIFPAGTFTTVTKIVQAPLTPNQEVSLVGFGETNAPLSQNNTPKEISLIKRYGKNRIASTPAEYRQQFGSDLYLVLGDGSSDGKTQTNTATAGHGDSGGPLIVGNTVAAVATSGGNLPPEVRPYFKNAEAVSTFASLGSAFARRFLSEAIAAGAKISFIDTSPLTPSGTAAAAPSLCSNRP